MKKTMEEKNFNKKPEKKKIHASGELNVLKNQSFKTMNYEINDDQTLKIEKTMVDVNFSDSREVFYKNFSTLYSEIFERLDIFQIYVQLGQDLNVSPGGSTLFHIIHPFIFHPHSVTGVEQKNVEYIRRKVFSLLFIYTIVDNLSTIIKKCNLPSENLQKMKTQKRLFFTTFLTNVKYKNLYSLDVSAEAKNELASIQAQLRILEKQAWSLLSITTPALVSAVHGVLERLPEIRDTQFELYAHNKRGYISFKIFKDLIFGETIIKDLKKKKIHTDISVLIDLINLLGRDGLPKNFLADVDRRNKLNSLLINTDKLLQLIYVHHVIQDEHRINKTLYTILPLYRKTNIIKMNEKIHSDLFTNFNIEISNNLFTNIMSMVTNISFGLLSYVACELQSKSFIEKLFYKDANEFISDLSKASKLISARAERLKDSDDEIQ